MEQPWPVGGLEGRKLHAAGKIRRPDLPGFTGFEAVVTAPVAARTVACTGCKRRGKKDRQRWPEEGQKGAHSSDQRRAAGAREDDQQQQPPAAADEAGAAAAAQQQQQPEQQHQQEEEGWGG